MKTITVTASRTYDVLIGRGLCDKLGGYLNLIPDFHPHIICILSDSNVFPLYGAQVQQKLEKQGYGVISYVIPAGEDQKNPANLIAFLNFLTESRLSRSDAVLALGGGVVGDLGGLAASLYLRGIPCVQMPTSLLAMVDSSVGGKTAVNLESAKNQVGTFTQPHMVLCDLDLLKTLPAPVVSEGWAEIIKYGMIFSADLLDTLQFGDCDKELEEIVATCVILKRDVVAGDERDTGRRQLLNFGHTLGHAVEHCAHYSMFHGEGVAIGMAVFTRACVKASLCTPACWERLEILLDKFNLPKTTDFPIPDLMAATFNDKKRNDSMITLVTPSEVGHCQLRHSNFPFLKSLLERGI